VDERGSWLCLRGLPLLALVVTAAHFLVVYGYPPLQAVTQRQPRDFAGQDDPERGSLGTRWLIDLLMPAQLRPVNEFLSVLAEQPGVVSIQTGEIDDTSE
jgi:putative Mg2+ transporter-C (MgtC) family protein